VGVLQFIPSSWHMALLKRERRLPGEPARPFSARSGLRA
jgi:hypothetical protein